jgi:D-3-phosphoglycerate dehydrogenase
MLEKLKISVLSGTFSKNPILLKEIKKYNFKQLKLNTSPSPLAGEALIEFLSDADGIIVGKDKIGEETLTGCRELKVISKYGVGTDNIDIEACNKKNIKVVLTKGINRRAVAEQTLYFMLGSIRNLNKTSRLLNRGVWERDGGKQLTGKTIGIIGVGNIGKEIISLLKPFKNQIMVNDIIEQSEYYKQHGLIETSKEKIYEVCDIVSLHTPLTGQTKNLINKEVFNKMKKHAFLINTARGAIVNQRDLKWALQNKAIAGAAVDVYEIEPPGDKEFLGLENLICTPHIGGNAKEAVIAMGRNAIDNLIGFFNDSKKNGNEHSS